MFISRRKWINLNDKIRDLERGYSELKDCYNIQYEYFSDRPLSYKVSLSKVIREILKKLNVEYEHINSDDVLKEKEGKDER